MPRSCPGTCLSAHRGGWIGAGIATLAAYGFVATFQDDPHFGRISPPTVASSSPIHSLGMLLDGFRPVPCDLIGAGVCLAGVAVIMYAPRPA